LRKRGGIGAAQARQNGIQLNAIGRTLDRKGTRQLD
jgi:hypothetical protein